MKIKLQSLLPLFVVIPYLGLVSCRSSETDNSISSGGIANLKINLQGTEFYGADGKAPTASINKSMANNSSDSYQGGLINASTVLEVKLVTDKSSKLSSASASSGKIAAVSGDPLSSGMKYRILAYDQNGNYKTSQDYTIGAPGVGLTLDAGASYTIVGYSYGSSVLPLLSASEQGNINSAQVNYDDNNRDFMYWSQSNYVPNFGDNTLNVVLRHKVTRITTVISAMGELGPISNITNASIATHFSDGIFSLANGSLSGRSTAGKASVVFSGPFPAATQTSVPTYINGDTAGNLSGAFAASMTIGGVTKNISLPNYFKITPGFDSVLTISLKRCGAYVAAGVWKDFMCHNLGADTSANPYTPSAAIHGAKYQWGAQTGEAGRYVSQANDQSSASTSGWITTPKANGSWSDAVKTANDPCPDGYRVPTMAQWNGLINNNTIVYIGTNWAGSPTNYANGIKVGSSLFLPATGNRLVNSGQLFDRGLSGDYWSSTEGTSVNANSLDAFFGETKVYQSGRTYGFAVRCIALPAPTNVSTPSTDWNATDTVTIEQQFNK